MMRKTNDGNAVLSAAVRTASLVLLLVGIFCLSASAASSVRGDFDANGSVTSADAVYLLRHVMLGDSYPIAQSGDVNGDGVLTSADAVYLLRYTLLGDLYPLAEDDSGEEPGAALYIYGSTVSDVKRKVESVRNSVEKGCINTDLLLLDGETPIETATTVPEIPKTVRKLTLTAVSLGDLSCLAGCDALEYLDLSGSQIDDLSRISDLPMLQELVVCNTANAPASAAGYAALLSSQTLKTVYVTSGEIYHKIYSLGNLPFALKYSPDLTVVTTFAELKNAFSATTAGEILFTSETGDYDTPDYSSCHTITVPAGEELVLQNGCNFTSMRCQINNYGTIRICGDWSCGMFSLENHGAVIIEKNGIYAGGMGDTTNYGVFTVEKGGLFLLQRGQRFNCADGSSFVNNGVVVNNFGGSFSFWGGSAPIVNNTKFYYDYDSIRATFGDEAIMDMRNVAGSGTIEQFDAQNVIAEVRKQCQ